MFHLTNIITMKNILFISLISIALFACQSKTQNKKSECSGACTGCSQSEVKASKEVKAGIYYFHGDRKCKTCKAVGKIAKEIANQKQVQFFDINFDQKENKDLAEKFQASSSGLFIKSKKSDKIEDVTTFAFRNAINDPAAYQNKLIEIIQSDL